MTARKVYVTDAQADAARMIVDHDTANGRETAESIRKIADAQPAAEATSSNSKPSRPRASLAKVKRSASGK